MSITKTLLGWDDFNQKPANEHPMSVYTYVGMCVCVSEREGRERERENKKDQVCITFRGIRTKVNGFR